MDEILELVEAMYGTGALIKVYEVLKDYEESEDTK